MPSTRSLKLYGAWCALIILGFAIYTAGLSGYWVFDDFHNIVLNQGLDERIWDWPHLMALLTSSDAGLFHRPLSVVSFYLDNHWFGLSPFAFKLTNVLIHLAAGLCFAGMGRSLLRLYSLRHAPAWDKTKIDMVVFITTALWLVHPINLTAVLYVVQRETSLAAVFTALAVWAYLRGRYRELEGKTSAWFIWVFTPGLTVLGLACKENAALVPLLILAIELTVLDFRRADGQRSRQALGFLSLFLVLPGLVVLIAMLRGAPALMGGYAIRGFTMGERLLTECRVLFSYLRWIALPDLRQLGLYHDDIVVSRGLMQPATTLPAVVGILSLLAGALALRRRLPLLCFGILWFFGAHVMESSVLPLELVFEHRNYVPLYGLLLGVVGALAAIDMPAETRKLLIAVAALVCLLFAGLTALRASEWRSPLAFAVYEGGHHPQSPRAQYEIGAILTAMVLDGQQQMADAADAAMLKARALDPDSIAEDLSLAMMHTSLGQADRARAYIEDATTRAGKGIPNAESQSSLQAAVTFSSNNKPLPFDAMDALFRTLLDNPRTGTNPCFKGDIMNTYALFLENNHFVPRAMSEMHAALQTCPTLTFVRINYATRLIIYHDVPDALDQIKLIEQANTYGQYSLYIDRLKTMVAETRKPH